MWTILFLGPDNQYLGHKKFMKFEEYEKFESILEDFCEANIEGKLSLKKRIEILGKENYYPRCGMTWDYKVI